MSQKHTTSSPGAGDKDGAGRTTGWSLRLGEREISILRDPFVIGRADDVDLYLDDVQVSRRHLCLHPEADCVQVEDLRSRNGSWLNHERCAAHTRVPMHPGDTLGVGPFELTLLVSSPRRSAGTEPETHAMRRAPQADTLRVPPPLSLLSPREREVFGWLARGRAQRDIAEHFGVSVKTIETHRTRIGQKLGVRTREELVRLALDVGVLRATPAD